MYEELSRLLAGELDASAEATLRARIASEPALARAWAGMSALPDLLGGLSLEAPPPALAARLTAQMADTTLPSLADELRDPALFDPALFDTADETMDPDADALTAPRHSVRARALARAPSSARGREAFLDGLLAASLQKSPRAVANRAPNAPRSSPYRRIGLTAAVAMMALAAGVVLGLSSPDAPIGPDAPAAVAVSNGTTTVDGTVDIRAGDVRVRVDGRARVTVEPNAAAVARDGSVVFEDGPAREIVFREAPATLSPTNGVATFASPVERVRERIVAAWSTGASDAPDATGRPPSDAPEERERVATNTPATSSEVPSYRVTVQVERGGAQIAYDGLSVALSVGESRTFDAGNMKPDGPRVGSGGFHVPTGTASDDVHDQHDIVRTVALVTALARTASHGGDHTTTARADTPKAGGPLYDEDRLLSVLEGVPGAELLDIDCSARPCIALIDYTGEDAAWGDSLGSALAKGYDAGVTLTQQEVETEGGSFGLAAVSVDEETSEGVQKPPNDKRARAALEEIERELTE